MRNKLITKIYKPYSVWGIRKEGTRNTVCNELRQAYQAIEAGDLEAAKLYIRVAASMTKAMQKKLKQYNSEIGKEMFPGDKELKKKYGSG